MRRIRFLLQKEFLQIFRNRAMLAIIFVMPIVQLLVLSNAATFEVKNTPMSLIDEDRTNTSRRLVDHMEASGYFTVVQQTSSTRGADEAMLEGAADLIVHIPRGFERHLRRRGTASVQLIFNGEKGQTAGVARSYALEILERYNRDIQLEVADVPRRAAPPGIRILPSHWFNQELDYLAFMVPGILVLLVTMIGGFLSAMNVVREKELGTIEQLNVSPLQKHQFIIGKLMPLWLIALFELAFGLGIARLVFEIPMRGSLLLVFALAAVYLMVILGLGLWISTVTQTQQQAMFVAWFFMVIFILMSGLFTPIESMPAWAQRLTLLNPIAYFITIMRRILLKGAGFGAVQFPFWALVVYAVTMLTLAVRQYRKVSG